MQKIMVSLLKRLPEELHLFDQSYLRVIPMHAGCIALQYDVRFQLPSIHYLHVFHAMEWRSIPIILSILYHHPAYRKRLYTN